jgi:Fe-S oxidoreductase
MDNKHLPRVVVFHCPELAARYQYPVLRRMLKKME